MMEQAYKIKVFLGLLFVVVLMCIPTSLVVAFGEEIPILTYHSVEPASTKKESALQKHYHVYPEIFKKQLEYLKENNYVPIPMRVYLEHVMYGKQVPKKAVVITFDDGWKNQYEFAYPILREFGYPATFYIITKYVGSHAYMTWDQVKELDQAGMSIESHTHTHENLTKIDLPKIQDELATSKKILEEKLGHKIAMIAYPYYANNAVVQQVAKSVGYSAARAGWTKDRNSKEVIFSLKSREVINNPNPFATK